MEIIDTANDKELMGFIHEDVKWLTNSRWMVRLEYALLERDIQVRFKQAKPWKWEKGGGFRPFKNVDNAIAILTVAADAALFLHTGISVDAPGVGPLVPLVSDDLTMLLLAQRRWVDVFSNCRIFSKKGPPSIGNPIWFMRGEELRGLIMPVGTNALFTRPGELAKLAKVLQLMGVKPEVAP